MQEDNLNPASKFYDQETGHIGGENENSDSFNDRTSQEDLRNSELNPINYTGNSKTDLPSFAKGNGSKLKAVTKVKQFGPIIGLLITIFGGFGSVMMISSAPAMVLTQFTETIKEKLDFQNYANSERMDQIIKMKLDDGNGNKNDEQPIIDPNKYKNDYEDQYFKDKQDRFMHASEDFIKRLEEVGFKVIFSPQEKDNPNRFGKKISYITFQFIGAANPIKIFRNTYDDVIRENIAIASAMDSVKLGQRGTQNDNAATVKNLELKLERALFTKAFNSKSIAKLSEFINKKISSAAAGQDIDEVPKKAKEKIEDDAKKAKSGEDPNSKPKKNQTDTDEISKTIAEGNTGGKNKSSAKNKMKNLVKGMVGGASDWIDRGCQLRQMIGVARYTQKIQTIANIARLAYFYASVADMIKADPDGVSEEELSAIASKFTALRPLEASPEKDPAKVTNTATDSLGYNILTNPSNVKSISGEGSESFEKFQATAPSEINDLWNNYFKPMKDECVRNKNYQAIKTVASIAFAMKGGWLIALGKLAIQGLISSITSKIESSIIGFVANQLISSVSNALYGAETEGEDLGNAFASGMAYVTSQQGAQGGLGLLGEKDALAYMQGQRKYIAKQAEITRYNTSPFDMTTKHTFMGSIASQFLPTITSSKSTFAKIQSFANISLNNISKLLPQSQAMASAQAYAEDSTFISLCQDPDFQDIKTDDDQKAAFTPFCTPIVGAPQENITGLSPSLIIQKLSQINNLNNNILSDENDLNTYISTCVDKPSNLPYGFDESLIDTSIFDDIKKILKNTQKNNCINKPVTNVTKLDLSNNINELNSLYSLFIADERAQCILDSNKNCQLLGKAANVTNSNNFTASTSDFSTGPDGSWGGHKNGEIPDNQLEPISFNTAHKIRPDASEAITKLNQEFKAKFGKDLIITDSYRDLAGQIECFNGKDGPQRCAKPGTSLHGWGIALDLGGGIDTFGSETYNWMKENSKKYGWYHPDWAEPIPKGNRPEPWHWEFDEKILNN